MVYISKAHTVKIRNDLTAELVRSILNYNPKTGIFIWRHRTDISADYIERWNKRYAGKKAGDMSNPRHVGIEIYKITYVAHRLAWLIQTGTWPIRHVDHVDGNPHNNTWNNLRQADDSQNSCNSKIRKTSKSGYKGVSWSSQHKKWIAQIQFRKKREFLGLFKTPKEAHAAYCKAAERLHKEFARFK
jgi:hypothetical protein